MYLTQEQMDSERHSSSALRGVLRYKASGVFWLFLYITYMDAYYIPEKSLGKHIISLSDMAI